MNTFLAIAQIVLAIALIGAVLLQSKGEELGGVFGGAQSVYQTRRGIDRLLFTVTVFMAIAFFARCGAASSRGRGPLLPR